jgi:hypothetical protein
MSDCKEVLNKSNLTLLFLVTDHKRMTIFLIRILDLT